MTMCQIASFALFSRPQKFCLTMSRPLTPYSVILAEFSERSLLIFVDIKTRISDGFQTGCPELAQRQVLGRVRHNSCRKLTDKAASSAICLS